MVAVVTMDYKAAIPLLLLGIVIAISRVAGEWRPPSSANRYLAWLADAELKNGIPRNLLVRVAHQESRFRPDIISGQVSSPAGAQGIMQIVPKWHPGVDPLNPSEAIHYAGKYLSQLHKQFGTWERALAAYNWGPGNLQKYLKGEKSLPVETLNYVAEITSDVFGGPVSG